MTRVELNGAIVEALYVTENYALLYAEDDGAFRVEIDGAVYTAGYEAVNRNTGIVELRTPRYIEGLMFMENTEHLIRNKPWEWHRTATAIAEAAADPVRN